MNLSKKLTALILSLIAAAAFMFAFSGINVKADEVNSATLTQIDATTFEDGLFLEDSLIGAVRYETKADATVIPNGTSATYGSWLCQPMSVVLSEPVDATEAGEWDGFLFRIKNTTNTSLQFTTLLLSGDSVGRNYLSSSDSYETFITEDGENLAVSGKGIYKNKGYFTLSGSANGTWNYKFDDIVVKRSDMTGISEVLFLLRVSETTQLGNGLVLSSIAVYKEDGSGNYTTKTLFNVDDCTVATEESDTGSDINYLNPENGKTVHTRQPVYNGTALPVPEEYREELHESAMEIISMKENDVATVTVNYISEDGESLSASASTDYTIGQAYEITPKEINHYIYSASSAALSGTVSDDMIINLTYVVDENNAPMVATEVNAAAGDNGLYITDSTIGGVRVTLNENAELIPSDPATYGKTVNLGVRYNMTESFNATSSSEWDGILIRMKNTGNKAFKFYFYLYNSQYNEGEGVFGRTFTSQVNRQEIFVDTEGVEQGETYAKGILTSGGMHAIDAGMDGTWNYRFSDICVRRADMNEVDSLMLGIREDDKTYLGCGITISSVALYKYDDSEEGYTVKTIFNAKDLVVSSDPDDTECGLNTANYDNGTMVNTAKGLMNNTSSFIEEQYQEDLHDVSRSNVTIELQGCTVKVNYVDEDGIPLFASDLINVKNGENYEVEIKEIFGYDYVSADKPLTGSTTEDIEITLTYAVKEFTITLHFVDEEGNKIAEDEVITKVLNDYVELKPEDNYPIDGYIYKSANANVKFTVMKNVEITLTYAKESGGCSSEFNASSFVIPGLALVAVALMVLTKRAKKD